MSQWPAKDPQAVLDYGYTIPLDEGDTVASYTFELVEGDVVIDSDESDGAQITVWLSGGTVDVANVFRVAWVTAAGREDDDLITLAVRDDRAIAALTGYADASAADLKAAFPRFAAVADSTVESWLEQARRSVDQSWTQGDYAMGQMLLAAHYMTLEGLGTGAEAEAAAQGLGEFKTIRSGSLTLERFSGEGGSSAAGTLGSTGYGRRWRALAKANRGGPRVTGTGTLPDHSLALGG